MKRTSHLIAAVSALTLVAGSAGAGTIVVDFQDAIASEQHPDYSGEARFYHVSVNPNNPGIGSFASTITGSNTPDIVYTRPFTEPVVGYRWAGGTNNILTSSLSGGQDTRLVYATQDTVFDGFGQNQLKFWDATDPGVDIATGGGGQVPFNVVADFNPGGGYRSLGGASGTVDVSGLATGSLYIFYGAFNATPSLSVVLKDTDGGAPDITIANAHTNGDAANRTEYYVAELDFTTAGGYDTIEFEWLADGNPNYLGNGRGFGALLTGTVPEPGSLALLALGGLMMAKRRRQG